MPARSRVQFVVIVENQSGHELERRYFERRDDAAHWEEARRALGGTARLLSMSEARLEVVKLQRDRPGVSEGMDRAQASGFLDPLAEPPHPPKETPR